MPKAQTKPIPEAYKCARCREKYRNDGPYCRSCQTIVEGYKPTLERDAERLARQQARRPVPPPAEPRQPKYYRLRDPITGQEQDFEVVWP